MNQSWYYEKDGQRHGAVTSTDIDALIRSRTIDGRTLVWAQGQPDWIPLAQTDLASLLGATDSPPALPGHRINNAVIWVLAFAPIIGLMLRAFLAGAFAPNEYMVDYAVDRALKTGQYWWVTILLNVGLSLWDEKRLKKAGVNTDAFGKMVLLIPVYLWKRAKSLNQSPAYFGVWVATFVVSTLAKL